MARDTALGIQPSPPRPSSAPGMNNPHPPRPTPALEALASSTDRNVIIVRDQAMNLRDNLVRVCDGERLERARELVSRAVAVALGKD